MIDTCVISQHDVLYNIAKIADKAHSPFIVNTQRMKVGKVEMYWAHKTVSEAMLEFYIELVAAYGKCDEENSR